MPPTLHVADLHFQRGGRAILRGITWTVQPGEHWAVLGANGCGKTSLINLITGYDAATSGHIEIDGAVFGDDDWREVRRRVGLVTSAIPALLETAEPVINVVASGRDAKVNLWQPPAKALCDESAQLLQRFGCGHLMSSLWGTLSQGERQKVLICRALMAQFRVLILDEPCAGLDPVAREHFLRWVQELCTQPGSPALVLVTHHVEEILPCLAKVLVLKNGQVLAAGDKAQVLRSATLSEAYGAKLSVRRDGERYRLAAMR